MTQTTTDASNSSAAAASTTADAAGHADMPAIAIDGLTFKYPPAKKKRGRRKGPVHPDRPALLNLSLNVQRGEIFGVLGPNGGGKTTLFRMLATVIPPPADVRQIHIAGCDLLRQPAEVRKRIGVVFQSPSLDVKLTARENLMHQGRLYGITGSDLTARVEAALEHLGLADRIDDITETFSGGMRRRTELAKSLLHEPELLLLDEPSTGLDPGARRDFWRQLERLREERGMTIALTTHLMDEADRCDRLVILHEGQVVAEGKPDDLKGAIGGDVVTIQPRGGTDEALAALAGAIASRLDQPGDPKPQTTEGQVRIEAENGPALVARLGDELTHHAARIAVSKPTLEDVFLHRTGELMDKPEQS